MPLVWNAESNTMSYVKSETGHKFKLSVKLDRGGGSSWTEYTEEVLIPTCDPEEQSALEDRELEDWSIMMRTKHGGIDAERSITPVRKSKKKKPW